MPKSGLQQPLAFDGFAELADVDRQQAVLAAFTDLGGNQAALLATLTIIGDDIKRLLAERDAFFQYRLLRKHERQLRTLVARETAKNTERGRKAAASAIAALDRVILQGAASDPRTLARLRKAAATGTPHEHAHHQVPPKRTSNVLTEDAPLRAIRRYFVPTVIRRVFFEHVRPLTPAAEKLELKRLRESAWQDEPAERAQELQRRVSEQLHQLTFELIYTLFPFIASGDDPVTPQTVIDSIKNARRPRR